METEPKFPIEAIVSISGTPKTLYTTISPENKTMPEGAKIDTSLNDTGIVLKIQGKMTLGRLKYTIDDILKSAILTHQIEQTITYDEEE